jgi:phosphoribosylaminoimidazolecarboxamide formyltransferase/IMP cyclohydrolase
MQRFLLSLLPQLLQCIWRFVSLLNPNRKTKLQVAEWLWGQVGGGEPAPEMSLPMKLAQGLRYGENPHQAAAFYTDGSLAEFEKGGIATAVQHHGKEMSYNNYLDADAAYSCCCDFKV